jgi:hypothetical protein
MTSLVAIPGPISPVGDPDQMSYKVQTLLGMLPRNHPFIPYILGFDLQQEDEPVVRAIALRMGIYLDIIDTLASDQFFETVIQIVNNLPDRFPAGYPTLQQMMDMLTAEFISWFKAKGINYDKDDYDDRLRAFIVYYNTHQN